MDSNGREVALAEELVELGGAQGALDKDDDLVELELVKEFVQLAILLSLFKRNEILLKTVERQLGVLVDEVLGRVLHELPADGLDIVRQSGREHHDLLLLRSGAEDLLDVTTHIYKGQFCDNITARKRLTDLIQHLVALIEDEHANTAKAKVLVANKGVETAGGADDDVGVGLLVLEELGVLGDGSAAVEDASLDIGHVLAETVVLIADLESKLACVAHNQDGALSSNGLNLLQRSQDEDSSLAETRLGLADDITTQHGLGDACLLNCMGR